MPCTSVIIRGFQGIGLNQICGTITLPKAKVVQLMTDEVRVFHRLMDNRLSDMGKYIDSLNLTAGKETLT